MFEGNLITFVSFLNIMLAFMLLMYNLKNLKSVSYLVAFLVMFSSFSLSANLLVNGGSVTVLAILLNNFAPFNYLFPVMLYFYVRSVVTENDCLRKYDFLHFIPFLINAIAVIPYVFTSFDYKYSIAKRLMGNVIEYAKFDFGLFYPHLYNNILRPLQFSIYLIACIALMVRYFPILKKLFGERKTQLNLMIGVLSALVISFFVTNVVHMAVFYMLINSSDYQAAFQLAQKLLNIISYLYVIIPLIFLTNPWFLRGNIRLSLQLSTVESFPKSTGQRREQGPVKFESQPEKDSEYLRNLTKNIVSYLEREKPYLQPRFSLIDVCTAVNAPVHQVQYCMNVILKKKFADLKNEMRVNHAIDLLKQNTTDKTSIEGLGRLSGFTSNSNFFLTFKKATGLTPNEWLKNCRENHNCKEK